MDKRNYFFPKYTISSLKEEIIKTINSNIITFISSPTGCGKSTQIPQYIFNNNHDLNIIVCEPRKIACESISKYIQTENQNINIQCNDTSFYFGKYYEKNFDILFITENQLLNILSKDPLLRNCDILLIDEVHERTMKLDLILFYMKYFTLTNNNINRGFKLILVSATFNITNIKDYFNEIIEDDNIGIIDSPINFNNYEIFYWKFKNNFYLKNENFDYSYIRNLSYKISQVIRYDINFSEKKYSTNKTILIFLPDYKSISIVKNQLENDFSHINIHEFTSLRKFEGQLTLLNDLEELKNNNKNSINIILSTTLAETCLTFPNCDVVIDTGIKKTNKYNYYTNINEENIEFISKESAIQRAGRCGRGKKKGKCYRLYNNEQYDKFREYRLAEVEYLNFDLIILKMFDNVFDVKDILNYIDKKGYLDFVSQINIDIIKLIIDKLKNSYSIDNNYTITKFGKWLCKYGIDLVTGTLIHRLDYKWTKDNNYDIKYRDFEIYRIISIISTINNINYELFNNDIDMSIFQLHILDYQNPIYIEDSVKYYSKELTKNIINKVLSYKIYNCDEEKIKDINYKYPYYKLFNELNKIYNAKNYFTLNKIFKNGELMITLFFIRQYSLIKCQYHYDKNDKYKKYNKCQSCQITKNYYCYVYSLNEKFFQVQKNRLDKILKSIDQNEIVIVKNFFKNVKNYEYELIYWNLIYLNLISNKPLIYLSFEKIKYLCKEIKKVNFDKILTEIYNAYYNFYTKECLFILNNRTILDNLFIKKTNENENDIKIYFSLNNKVKIDFNYFFDFYKDRNSQKEVNTFFSLSKYKKKDEKLYEIGDLYYYKNINPIFEVMKKKGFVSTLKLEQLEELDKNYKIKPFENIGLYFFINFIKEKIDSNNFIYYNNLLIYYYNQEDKDSEEKIKEIEDIIKQGKENYKQLLNYHQCLKNGCLTIELSQGLNIENVFDSFSNYQSLIYEVIDMKNINNLSVKYLTWLCRNKKIKYKRIFTFNDKTLITFQNVEEVPFFLKNTDLILKNFDYENKNSSINNYTVYFILFDKNDSNEYIHRTMMNYFRNTLNIKSTYIINENETKENKLVYYYILNKYNIPENIIVGQKINFEDNDNIFQIENQVYNSDKNFFSKFYYYCLENDINIIKIPELSFEDKSYFDDTFKYQIINNSLEKYKLIKEYISPITVQLNRFALNELKYKSKDTFLENNEDLFNFARRNFCNISIIYFDNKIIIYGSPENRNKLKSIFIKYLENLLQEKIIYSIRKKEEKLTLKYLVKKFSRLKIGLLITKNDINDIKLEFRKKYLTNVKKLLKGENKIKNLNPYNKICEICLEKFNNIKNNNYIQLKICGHYFCVECLKMQIVNDIKFLKNLPIKCVKCNTFISNNDIFELFIDETEDYNYISRNLINLFMLKNKNFNWCPNYRQNCLYIYNKSNYQGKNLITCPNCNVKICLICDQIIEINKEHNKNCRKKILSKLTKEDRNWLIKNSKNCPICNSPYEKINGCNHMTCMICNPQIHFCYICGEILNSEDPYIHFNNPKLKCYQRLWDKIEENERNDTSILNIDDKEDNKSNNSNNENSEENKLNITNIILSKINNNNENVEVNHLNKDNIFIKKNNNDDNSDFEEYLIGYSK